MTTLENKFEEEKLHPLYPKRIKKTDDKEETRETANVELNPSITQPTITKIRGVGPSVAEKLRSIGLNSIDKIANSPINHLTAIRGIGQVTAQKIIEGAKSLVPRKNLKSYPQSQNKLIPNVSLEPVFEEVVCNDVSEEGETIEDVEEYDIIEDFHPSKIQQKAKPEIVYSSLTSTIDTPSSSIQRDIPIQQKTTEKLNPEEKRVLIQNITNQLQVNGYHIMKTAPKLKKLYSLVDLIALKFVSLNELVDQIVFIPIKISDLKGEFLISNETITYSPEGQNLTDTTVYKTLLDSYFGHLEQFQTLIYQDFQEQRVLVNYLNRFHDLDITLKTSIFKKNLAFALGDLQLKLLVEPILVSKNRIGFMEKVVPFAYLKDANLHIIQITQLSSLLPFLEDKYRLLETHYKQDDSLISYQDAQCQLLRRSELLSVPFLGFGGLLLIVALIRSGKLLLYLLNIGYALLGIYLISLLYFTMRFFKQKIELHKATSTPYHKKKITIDNTNLVLINEKLSGDMMTQFVFETIGKHHASKFLTKIEESGIKQRAQSTQLRSKIEKESFFEQKQPQKKPKNKYITRFASFLED